jgi:hypothetical protein
VTARGGGADWRHFVLRTPVIAFRAAGQACWSTFVLRTPVFAFRTAGQAHWSTFVLRTPEFAFRAAVMLTRPAWLQCSLKLRRSPAVSGSIRNCSAVRSEVRMYTSADMPGISPLPSASAVSGSGTSTCTAK